MICLAFAPLAPAQGFDPNIGPLPRIISPANHAVFYAPVNIPVFAFAIATNVEFYAGTIDLGRGYNLGLGLADRQPGIDYPDFVIAGSVPRLDHIYYRIWTNVPPGSYALTAVTTNGLGGLEISRTSPPVNITVLASTSTTGPRVVDIVAGDPIAIAGTNSWTWLGMTNETPTWADWPPLHFQSFTNWGPKDALFLVQSYGDTSDTFTVTYNISGTASNGVDYEALPGSVTIPAGQSQALIPIVPIDNGPPYAPKTVILTLTPATNAPPPLYVLGSPTNAEALILEARPVAFPWLLPDGTFHVNASGPDGAWFILQNSTDLQNWLPVATNQIFQGSIDFVDPNAPGNSMQFYRTVQLDSTPSQ
jgi:hypothetical protein